MSTTAEPTRDVGSLKDKVRSLRIPPAPPPARASKLPWFLCALLAVGIGYLAWQLQLLKQGQLAAAGVNSSAPADTAARPRGDSPGGDAANPATTPPAAPTVADSGGVVHESKGYLLPRHQILISPKVGGMVKSLRVRPPGAAESAGQPLIEGMQVRKGDILAQLETTDYDADVLQAQANLARAQLRLEMERKNLPREIERAKAELAEAVEMRDFYKVQLDRWSKLSKTSTVSPADIEKAETDFQAAGHRVDRLRRALDLVVEPQEQRLKVAESDVAVAQAELTKADWRRGNTVITAPVTGTVLKKNVEEGNIVNPGAFNGSFSICDLADLADLEVELDIQERDISRIFAGQKCVVRSEAFQNHPYEGYVSRLMPIANRSKGSIPVRVKVQIPPGMEGVHLKPEMGAIVAFYKDRVDPDSTTTAAAPPDSGTDLPESSAGR